MLAVTAIGLDIAKSVFQVHGIDAEGKGVCTEYFVRWLLGRKELDELERGFRRNHQWSCGRTAAGRPSVRADNFRIIDEVKCPTMLSTALHHH
jgi:hypothetical protein